MRTFRQKEEVVRSASRHVTDVSKGDYKIAAQLPILIEVLTDIRDILDATGPLIGALSERVEELTDQVTDNATSTAQALKPLKDLTERVAEIGGVLEKATTLTPPGPR